MHRQNFLFLLTEYSRLHEVCTSNSWQPDFDHTLSTRFQKCRFARSRSPTHFFFAVVMSLLEERVAKLLERLKSSQVLLVEWETELQIRLGYPLVSNGVS